MSIPRDFCAAISSIAKRAGIKPADLKPGETFDIAVELDFASDGLRVTAARCDGFSAVARYKRDDIVIPMKAVMAAHRSGDHRLVDVVVEHLKCLMLRMRFVARPPKGWRLFGRRPRVVFA